jgi:DNA polymerase-4
MSKILLHIDLNAFFATCEEIKNPSLIGKPLIVGGDGRSGIVSTASYEARKYGIHSGMPTFQAKMLCKNLIICNCDFNYYSLMSKEFIHYIEQYSPLIEQMSIDECFVDITETYKKYGNNDINQYLKNIQDGLFKKTKLKCSIGVAPTKFLAKMASDMKKPMGITIVRKKDIPNMIFPLSIKNYFGIGKKTYPKLEKMGILTIGDLYSALKSNNQDIIDFMGSFSNSIIQELEGNSDDQLNLISSDPKSIGVSRTLMSDSDDSREIKDYLLKLAKGVVEDMKSKNFLTKTITIQFKDANFDTTFKTKSYSKSFDEPTEDIDQILMATSTLFDNSYSGNLIRLVGFSVKNLKEKHSVVTQMHFDDYEEHEKENEISMIIGDLNRKMKSNTFIRLSDLEKKK